MKFCEIENKKPLDRRFGVSTFRVECYGATCTKMVLVEIGNVLK